MPSWLLQILLAAAAALTMILFLVRKTCFGRESAYTLRLRLMSESAVKVSLLTTAIIALLLAEVQLNVLSASTSKGPYSSIRDPNASMLRMFAAMDTGVMLVRALNNVVNDFLDQGLAAKRSERLNEMLTTHWLTDKNYY